VDLLREAGALSVSLVAEVNGVAVGHVAFSPVQVASGCVGTLTPTPSPEAIA